MQRLHEITTAVDLENTFSSNMTGMYVVYWYTMILLCPWEKHSISHLGQAIYHDIVVSLGKTQYFSFGPSNLPVVLTQLDERLANRTQNKDV